MMAILELHYEGEPLKIDVDSSTTAREVCDKINDRWPGTAYPINELGYACVDATNSIEELVRIEKRKQKSIDRIAWKAEAEQRRAKGGHWK